MLEPLLDEALAPVALDLAQAWRAARLRANHYDRRSCPVSLADCVLLASAGGEDRVASSDPQVLHVAEREGIATLPLPDERGRGAP